MSEKEAAGGEATLAEAVRGFRTEEMAMGLDDFAAESGVSKPTLVDIEAGRRRPRPSTYRKLAKIMGVPVKALLGLKVND